MTHIAREEKTERGENEGKRKRKRADAKARDERERVRRSGVREGVREIIFSTFSSGGVK